jgi:hypothetical protein
MIENGDVTPPFLKFRHKILDVVIRKKGIKEKNEYRCGIASGRGKIV